MREENHKIPLSGLSYLHLLGELGHIYLSANLITKTLRGARGRQCTFIQNKF